MNALLDTIGASAVGTFMATNPIAFPVVETIHVMAITAVIGFILIVDLRLIGIASQRYSVSGLARTLLPSTWIAFCIAVITGSLLFSSNPSTYAGNFAFQMKLGLIAAAGLNMLLFHLVTMRSIAQWDHAARLPAAARGAGLASILIWIFVAGFGRWVGFTIAPF
ncbi:MAG: hypothetical protein J7485_05335 [Sphingobium sp.]|nr:hypothetical protein [Sphingobium sp.]